MSKEIYVGVNNKAHKVNGAYVGVDGKARKVVKGYVGVNGKAQLFYESEPFELSYTGNYIEEDIISNGKAYKLFTLTSSGTLTINKEVDVWLCGGGAGGKFGAVGDDYGYVYSGAGGGGGYASEEILPSGTYDITIGAGGATGSDGAKTIIGPIYYVAGGTATSNFSYNKGDTALFEEINGSNASKIPDIVDSINLLHSMGGNGGTGGGSGGIITIKQNTLYGTMGLGDGKSKIPFKDKIDYFTEPLCAGGAGGATLYYEDSTMAQKKIMISGGQGGSNGNDGKTGTKTTIQYAKGGNYGGGDGAGAPTLENELTDYVLASPGITYGSGGGGGYSYYDAYHNGVNVPGRGNNNYSEFISPGADGYQGVVYILAQA